MTENRAAARQTSRHGDKMIGGLLSRRHDADDNPQADLVGHEHTDAK